MSVYTAIIPVEISLIFVISAFVLGALHALEPGHGKSFMAAFVMGTNAKLKDAILLGLTVVFSHVSVFILLGIALIFLIAAIGVNAIHELMSLIGGTILIIVGIWIVRKFYKPHNHHHHEYNIDSKRCSCNWIICRFNIMSCRPCSASFQSCQ